MGNNKLQEKEDTKGNQKKRIATDDKDILELRNEV